MDAGHVGFALQGPSVVFEHGFVVDLDVLDLAVLLSVEGIQGIALGSPRLAAHVAADACQFPQRPPLLVIAVLHGLELGPRPLLGIYAGQGCPSQMFGVRDIVPLEVGPVHNDLFFVKFGDLLVLPDIFGS